jgi:hypothetical protein
MGEKTQTNIKSGREGWERLGQNPVVTRVSTILLRRRLTD